MGIAQRLKNYSQNSFAKNLSVLVGGTAFAQILVIGTSPFITRLYTPEDFGVLAVFSSILGVLAVSSSFKYHLAIPLPLKDEDAIQLLVLSLFINLIFGILVGFITYFSKPFLYSSNTFSIIIPYLWILPLSIIGYGTYETLKYWAIRESSYKKIAITKISQNSSLVLTQLGLGFLYNGPLGLLLGDAVGRSGGTISLLIIVIKKIRNYTKLITLKSIVTQAIRYKRFPLYSSGSGVINSLGLQLTPLLIVNVLGPVVAGYFALTQRITSVPLSLIGKSYSQVYYKEAVDRANKSKWELKKVFLQQSKALFFLGLLPALIFIFIGSTGFGLIFGEEWETSGHYAQILAPMLVLQFVVVPLSQTLNILGKQNLQLVWDILRLLSILACFWAIRFFNLPASTAIIFISGTMTFLYSILYLLIYKQVQN